MWSRIFSILTIPDPDLVKSGICFETCPSQTREALRSKIVTVESESSGDGADGNVGDDSGGGGGGGDDSNEDGGSRVKKIVLPVTYDITALQL